MCHTLLRRLLALLLVLLPLASYGEDRALTIYESELNLLETALETMKETIEKQKNQLQELKTYQQELLVYQKTLETESTMLKSQLTNWKNSSIQQQELLLTLEKETQHLQAQITIRDYGIYGLLGLSVIVGLAGIFIW